MIELVLIKADRVKTIDVSLDSLYRRSTILRSDYRTQDELLTDLLLEINTWSASKGYKGALPSGFVSASQNEPSRFECTLIFGRGAERRDARLPVATPDNPSLFREVHQWSRDQGYTSAFPIRKLAPGRTRCVALTPERAIVRKIPIAELSPNTEPAP